MTFGLGTLGGAAVFWLAPALVRVLHVPASLAGEAAAAFRLFAVAVPFTITTPVLSAVLESRRRFDLVNAVAVPSSAVTYLGPVAVLAFTRGLVPVIGILVAGRVLTWLAYVVLCVAEAPALLRPRVDPPRARPLLAFGGWTTVSAVVSPLLVSMDRFVVGTLLSAAAVAYYFTGQEAVLRMGMVSGAVVTVLFPAAAAVRADEGRRLGELLESAVDAVGLLILPLTLLLAAFPGELLRAWLGARYAAEGETVLVWLSVGLLVNSLAKMPSSLLQAQGRPDLTAWLHVAELPPFVAVLCLLVWRWGIDGAAAAWVARAAVDAAALFWISARRFPDTRGAAGRAAALALAGAASVVALRLLPGPEARAVALAAAAVPIARAGWRVLRRRADLPAAPAVA
jgi:O-antigen/teichoic acid export membrane protein